MTTGLLRPSTASSRARHASVSPRCACQPASCCPLRHSLAPVTLLLFPQLRVILGAARRAAPSCSPQRPREITRELWKDARTYRPLTALSAILYRSSRIQFRHCMQIHIGSMAKLPWNAVKTARRTTSRPSFLHHIC